MGCVPTALLDPTAANILKTYVPHVNAANNNWVGNYTTPTNQDEYLGKYDQVIGERDHVSASYFTLKSVSGAFGGASSSANIPFSVNQSNARQQDFNISDVHTFNGTYADLEIETNGTIAPAPDLVDLVTRFNVSPKLSGSGVPVVRRLISPQRSPR